MFLDKTLDLAHTFKSSKLKISNTFFIIGEKNKKIRKNWNFYANPIFNYLYSIIFYIQLKPQNV